MQMPQLYKVYIPFFLKNSYINFAENEDFFLYEAPAGQFSFILTLPVLFLKSYSRFKKCHISKTVLFIFGLPAVSGQDYQIY